MIFTGFSPNSTWKDVKIVCSYLFLPWKWFSWKDGKHVGMLEQSLKQYLPTKHAVTFDSGRSSLQAALCAARVGEGDEVIVQAYTCVVVINPILALKAKPIFVDVENNFNARISEIEEKITDKTKAIIVQYTFGEPSDIEKIIKLSKQHSILVIEDCAHSLGAEFAGRKLGTFADMAMWSFGSDKIISSVRGGAVTTNNDSLAKKLEDYRAELPYLPKRIIWQHLNSLLFFPLGKMLYSIGMGKLILYLVRNCGFTNKIVYDQEKQCCQPAWMPAKFPNVLANLAFQQLRRVDHKNKQRKLIAEMYDKEISNPYIIKPRYNQFSNYLRYTVLTPKPEVLHAWAKKDGIILGDWYNQPIAPNDTNLEKTGYKKGQCSNAERLCLMSVNLPTNISENKARLVISVINKYNQK